MKNRTICIVLIFLLAGLSGCLDGSPAEDLAAMQFKGKAYDHEPMQNFSLTDQNNVTFYLDQYDEKIIVIAFIFTRCPDVCPTITQNLASVANNLGDSYNQDVFFISVTLDPDYDSPDLLKSYTTSHSVDWVHLTGEYEEVEDVWEQFYPTLLVNREYIDSHDPNYTSANSEGPIQEINLTMEH